MQRQSFIVPSKAAISRSKTPPRSQTIVISNSDLAIRAHSRSQTIVISNRDRLVFRCCKPRS
ncbi:MAG: hypothetical protein LBU73_00450 [Helicobacteraceae bacterium]|nr:hypothetical protein [Helicobacteraceae bacterium]